MNLLLLFIWLLITATPTTGVSVNGTDVFNTSGFDCAPEKIVHETAWVNDIGNIRIYNAKLWTGAYYGTIADIGAIVYRASDETILFHENWDHYAEPTGLHVGAVNLTPNYIELKEGDSLNMAYWCQQFNEPLGQANLILTIWYGR